MSRKLTQKEFLERFKEVHGDKYDYSLVEYVNNSTKVKIICKKDGHGIFEQNPDSHSRGQGCPDCGLIQRKEKRKLGFNEFVERSNVIHGNFYGYEKVEYVNNTTNVIIICPKHGEYLQKPVKHLIGRGCPDCGIIKRVNSTRKTTEHFIEDSKLIHGNEYDYSHVKYVNSATIIKIICKKDGHGVFTQTPSNHLRGQGCPVCGRIKSNFTRTKSTGYFIKQSKEVHPDKNYGYEKVIYIESNKKVIIVCPEHGDFSKTPHNHLRGQGCPICGELEGAEKRTYTNDEFVELSNLKHNNFYGYEKVEYNKSEIEVIIVCPVHGDFPQLPNNHLQGKGCPKCTNKREGRLAIILNEIGVVHRNHRINNRFFDFYLPDYNLIIERDGEQHYFNTFRFRGKRKKSIEEHHQNDIEKTKLAKSKSHKICRIPYWLSEEDERKEIQNILNGQPTYPDVPDLEHEKTKPLPN